MSAVLQSSVNWVFWNFLERLGNPYVYGGMYAPALVPQGCDCSGVASWVLQALTLTPPGMPLDENGNWLHTVSTESWGYDYSTCTPVAPGTVGPYGTVAVASLVDIPESAALTVDIMHGGGGESSHMQVSLLGTLMESNGTSGTCTNGTGAYTADATLWTDHWYLPGPIVWDVLPAWQVYITMFDQADPTVLAAIGAQIDLPAPV